MLSKIEKVAEEMGFFIKNFWIDEQSGGMNFCLRPLERDKSKTFEPQKELKIGDRITIPSLEVPACEIEGEHFEALSLKDVPAVLVDTKHGKVFSFENILFRHCVDAKESEKSFENTPLGKYLAGQFTEALRTTFDESLKDVSLLSADNVFNNDSDDYMPYFKNEAHRIKAYQDEAWWWWLKTSRTSNETYYCAVGNSGYSNKSHASDSKGGIAPVLYLSNYE